MRNAILVDYHFCTGCKTCEMACQVEKNLPLGRNGVVVREIGPWEIQGDTWQDDYVPLFTDECDLCADRVARGEKPTCVKHCLAAVLTYGPADELLKLAGDKPKHMIVLR